MSINITTVKSILWFILILLLVFSFPLQVIFNNPYPALSPYILLVNIIFITFFVQKGGVGYLFSFRPMSRLTLMVSIYVLLVCFNTAWQTLFNVITIYEGVSVVVIYLLPVFFYWYFKSIASEKEIRAVLLAMVMAGFVVGVYFAYDSYLKLAIGHVSDYAFKAFDYSVQRSGVSVDQANTARINLGSRSMGLLQSHTVSGAWVILGALAALALISKGRKIIRSLIVLGFGVFLVLGLNFTTIIAFFLIFAFMEFGGYSFFRGKIIDFGQRTMKLGIISFILIVAVFAIAGESMSTFIVQNLSFQTELLLGTGGDISMAGLASETLGTYIEYVFAYPFIIIVGDGFSSFGFEKASDVGIIETMSRFGLPFFIASVIGLIWISMSALKRSTNLFEGKVLVSDSNFVVNALHFSVCVIFLILITEGHYSVWNAKSILPIVFFALALYERYMRLSSYTVIYDVRKF